MKAEQIVHKMEKMVSLAKLALKTEEAQAEAEATNLLEQLEAEMQTICAVTHWMPLPWRLVC